MITVWVPGKPQPQGSKKGFIVNGRIVLVESAKGLKPWRQKIQTAITHANGYKELQGAVHVSLSFYFKKPKSNNKKAHTQKPDIDKLIRACLDSFTGTVIKDDSQVVSISAWKYWAKQELEGVNISIWEVDGHGVSNA